MLNKIKISILIIILLTLFLNCTFLLDIHEVKQNKINEKQLKYTAKKLVARELIGIWLKDTMVADGSAIAPHYSYRICLFSDSTFSILENKRHLSECNTIYFGKWRRKETLIYLIYNFNNGMKPAKVSYFDLHNTNNEFVEKANSFIENDSIVYDKYFKK